MSPKARLTTRNETPHVGIVIPVWNSRELTLACLESVYQLDYASAIVTIVDNGSSDMTSEVVRERYPEIHIIRNEENLGFARACNQGMMWCFAQGADHVLLLNNDTSLDANMLARLVDAAEQYPEAGIFGPRIGYADDPSSPWFTGYRFKRDFYIVRTSDPRHLVQANCPASVDFISGCGMLVTRKLFEAIGGFHEQYFMYYEDIDYCLTAKQHGFDVMYIPHARMCHEVSASSGGKNSVRKQVEQVKSCWVFCRRHTKGLSRWINMGVRVGHAVYVTAFGPRKRTRSNPPTEVSPR